MTIFKSLVFDVFVINLNYFIVKFDKLITVLFIVEKIKFVPRGTFANYLDNFPNFKNNLLC